MLSVAKIGNCYQVAKDGKMFIRSRYVQMPILATLVSSKFAKFGNRQCLPILATDDTCQFLQLLCLQNLPILATYNICQFWQLMILANFDNFCVFKICHFWLPTTFANPYLQHLPIPLFSPSPLFFLFSLLLIYILITCMSERLKLNENSRSEVS